MVNGTHNDYYSMTLLASHNTRCSLQYSVWAFHDVSMTNWFKWFEMRMCGASIGFRYLMGNDENLCAGKWVIPFSRPMAISTSFSCPQFSFAVNFPLVFVYCMQSIWFGNQALQRRCRVRCCHHSHFRKFTSVFAIKIKTATKWFRIKY